jgi:hypothetical protein
VFGTSETLIVRYAHRDDACPSGYENGTFVQFGAHHGRNGYGAWIQNKPEQEFEKPAGTGSSPAEVQSPNNSE